MRWAWEPQCHFRMLGQSVRECIVAVFGPVPYRHFHVRGGTTRLSRGVLQVISRNILSQWGLYALNAVMLLAITPLLVHGLGDDAFGVWVITGNAIAWLMVMDFGIGSAVLRFGALILKQDKGVSGELQALFNSALFMFMVIGGLAIGIALLLGGLIPDRFFAAALTRGAFVDFSLILGLALALNFWGQAFSAMLQAYQRFDLVNMIKVIGLLLRIILYGWLMMHGYGLLGLASATLASTLVSTAVLLIVSRVTVRWRISLGSFSSSWVSRLFGYGGLMLVIVIADQVRFALDSVIVAAYLSLALVTVYGIGAALTTVFREVVGALVPVFVPLFSEEQANGASPRFLLATRLFSLAVWGFGLLLIVVADPFIRLWMGDYGQSAHVAYVLIAGFLVASSQSLSFSLMYGQARHLPVAVISVIDALANLGLSLWLVRGYGVIGVSLGTSIPFLFTYGILFPVIVSRSLSIPLYAYVREALLIPGGFALLVLALAVLAGNVWRPVGWPELILSGLLIVGGYALLAWFSVVGGDGRLFLRKLIQDRALRGEAE